MDHLLLLVFVRRLPHESWQVEGHPESLPALHLAFQVLLVGKVIVQVAFQVRQVVLLGSCYLVKVCQVLFQTKTGVVKDGLLCKLLEWTGLEWVIPLRLL